MHPSMSPNHLRATLSLLLPVLVSVPTLPACTNESLNDDVFAIDGEITADEGTVIIVGGASSPGPVRVRIDGKLLVQTCDPNETPDLRDPECGSNGYVIKEIGFGPSGGDGLGIPGGSHSVQFENADGNAVYDFGVIEIAAKEFNLVLMYDSPTGLGHHLVTTRRKDPVDEPKIAVRVFNLTSPAGLDLVQCSADGKCAPLKTGIAYGERFEQELDRSAGTTVQVVASDEAPRLENGADLSRQCHSFNFMNVLPLELREADLDCPGTLHHIP